MSTPTLGRNANATKLDSFGIVLTTYPGLGRHLAGLVIGVLVAGAIAAVVYKGRALSFVALGIVINAAVFLCFDVIAERRGETYLQALKE